MSAVMILDIIDDREFYAEKLHACLKTGVIMILITFIDCIPNGARIKLETGIILLIGDEHRQPVFKEVVVNG